MDRICARTVPEGLCRPHFRYSVNVHDEDMDIIILPGPVSEKTSIPFQVASSRIPTIPQQAPVTFSQLIFSWRITAPKRNVTTKLI